jgi:opacity protein-like surface antigen
MSQLSGCLHFEALTGAGLDLLRHFGGRNGGLRLREGEFGVVNNDDVRTGWVLGAGVEYAFTNNLTAGIEGLWVNLEQENNGAFIGTVPAAGGGRRSVFVAGRDDDDEADFFIARAKLNFKFGTF